ncbi:MAG: hypothetical protein J5525_05910 [Lachnospiraceae bacterium]|nr:hypothetical protein [Lachnospiraceae bacterium]
MKKISPIIDPKSYDTSLLSFTGGALKGSNTIFLCNKQDESLWKKTIDSYRKTEEGFFSLSFFDDNIRKITLDEIRQNHIINYFDLSRIGVYQIYRLLQLEVDSLVNNSNPSTICSIFHNASDKELDLFVTEGVCLNMLNGLACLLSVHNITYSGIRADSNVPIDTIMRSALFLSSKYGQLFSGEAIYLRNSDK